MDKWRDVVQQAMAENGLHDPSEVIAGFLALARFQHRFGEAGNPKYNDCLDSITRQHATSVTETLAILGDVHASVLNHNAGVYRQNGDARHAEPLEAEARMAKAVSQIMTYALPVWNADVSDLEAGSRALRRDLERQKGSVRASDDEETSLESPKRF